MSYPRDLIGYGRRPPDPRWSGQARLALQIVLKAPKMMSVGLHARLVGRPGRLAGLARFLDHVAKHDRVWICRRLDIARHWIATHPYRASLTPSSPRIFAPFERPEI